MFEVIDLSGRALPELKEIAKAFSIDTKGLAKNDLVLKIADAQGQDTELARVVADKFPQKEHKEHKEKENRESRELREKRPRKVKLDPMPEHSMQEEVSQQREE